MTTPPNAPDPDDDRAADTGSPAPGDAPGVELGESEGGGTFEPEEDPEAGAG